MIRFFIKLTLILFIITSSTTALVFFSSRNSETMVENNIEGIASDANVAGRFIEYMLNERVDRLMYAAGSGDTEDILRSLLHYTNYVGQIYAHKGPFMIGLKDTGFMTVNSFNSTKPLCSHEKVFNDEISKKLIVGKVYLGPVSDECLEESGERALMLIAVPVPGVYGFNGVVYEVSNIMKHIYTYDRVIDKYDNKKSMLVIDDIARYENSSENYKLLSLKNSLKDVQAAEYKNGSAVGFYSFYVRDEKLTFIMIRDMFERGVILKCCPWLQEYIGYLFIVPFVLLMIWVILEFFQANLHLEKEVEVKTGRFESLQKRYQLLFGTIPEYVVLYNYDGEILETNERFHEVMHGGNPKGANMLFMIKEKERFGKMIESLKHGESFSDEFLLFISEEQVSVSVTSSVVEIDGEDVILSVLTDISGYKKMQNKYFAAQKKEAVGTLAAGMVHDFSNILQNLSLQYSLLERSDEDSRGKNMENIKGILDGANTYLTSVLKYTKSSEKVYVTKRGGDFIKEALDTLERVLPPDTSISYEDNSENIMIKAEQIKITQILINLCQNAADAMDGRGVIFIKSYIEQKSFGNFLCVSVRDTGKGIEPEYAEKIYKPFFTTKTDKGTGLGLATVKQVVVELGGMIEMNSELGQGTEFVIKFMETK